MKQLAFLHVKQSSSFRVLWLTFIFIALSFINGVAGSITSNIAGGNWNANTTWIGDVVPGSIDAVTIAGNAIVYVNIDNAVCTSIQIGVSNNGTGTLSFSSSSSQLVVSGNFILGDNNGTNAKTGSLNMTNGGILKIGGNSTSPNLGTYSSGTGTVEYNGTTQTVFSTTYNNLTLSGSGVKAMADRTYVQGTLTINNGVILDTRNNALTLKGDFIKNGNLLAGSSNIAISGSANQNIAGFTATGLVSITKDEGVATFTGNVIGGTLAIGGNLNLGAGLTHTITGNCTLTNGTLNGGSSTLRLGSGISGTGVTFIAGMGTVEFNGVVQNIPAFNYYNLTISGTTGTKTIPAGSAVTVNGVLTTNGLLAINSDATPTDTPYGLGSGSLIVNGTSNGTVTYNRWLNHANKIAPTKLGYSRWYITSPPVNAISGFDANAIQIHQDANLSIVYDFATYNESDNDWSYVSAIPAGLVAGKGYLISLNPSSDGIIKFTGKLNNDNVTPAVTASANNGWNAVGNPYTSAIKVVGEIGSFLDVNKTNLNPDYAAIYVWNEDAVYTGTQQYYKVIGNSGYKPGGVAFSVLQESNIQAGQGFLIHPNIGSSTVTFTKAMQVHQTGLSLKLAEISWPGLTLLAESHGQTRSTVVAFNEMMTTGLDVTYDAGLLASDYFQVYTHLVGDGNNAVDFAIQCLPDNQYTKLSVPVGVDLPEGGDLVFKASGIILPDGLYPIIEDRLLNMKTSLKTEADSYTVTLDKNTTGIGRFYLSIGDIALWKSTVQLEKKYTASFINNRITINGTVEHGTKALLYDISGRKMGEYTLEDLNRNEIYVSGLSQRVYLLKIEGKNYSQALKLVAVNTNY